jgi:hypothetical protein
MAIALRVAGTAVTNTVSPNPSTGAGLVASDISILWVMAKPAATKTPADVTIPTPTNWIKLGQWASGSQVSATPPGNTGSMVVAAFVRVGAAASTAIGAISTTNTVTTAAVINSYSTSLTNGWIYALTTAAVDEAGLTTSFAPIGAADVSVTTNDFLLVGWAHALASTLTSKTVTATGATLSGGNYRQDATSVLNSGNLGFGTFDAVVASGTSTAGPLLASTTLTDGIAVFLKLRDANLSIASAETVTTADHVSGVPNLRTWQNGQNVMAADMNFQIRDPFNWLLGYTRPGIKVRNTTAIPYAAGSETPIFWDSADTQVGDVWFWPKGTQVMVGEPGTYTGQISFNANDTGTMNTGWVLIGKLYIFRGQTSTEQIINQTPDMGTGGGVEQSFVSGGLPFTVYLRAGDYVELRVSGGWSAGGAGTLVSFIDQQPTLDLWWSSKWEG